MTSEVSYILGGKSYLGYYKKTSHGTLNIG